MKASILAGLLSLFFIPNPLFAADKAVEKTLPPPLVQATKKIDLNKADAKELTHSVPGIGKKRAEAIVRYRDEHGIFHAVEDLAHVRGLGKQFVQKHLAQLQEVFVVQ
ncbi:ComEA family DNA-binding protein [Legionella septentrionalis]|uniref:ComEA family DNA-binding protein n=1 Tax=Legionella septentrionalis TaxID=2498109 RepID=UPI000F8EFFB3|nr:helix-hairpin-helix domain-containing protein [Legionella septentrionalis]RUQ95708.1 helix-hairpin-helix domain-containing protein [Legionella septentrionalis]